MPMQQYPTFGQGGFGNAMMGAKPQQPMPGQMLHDPVANQFGGAGVMKRADGRVTFTGGPPLPFTPPASKYGSLAEWQANEESRRMRTAPFRGQGATQLVSTGAAGPVGAPGAPTPALASAVASPTPVNPKYNPRGQAFLEGTGMAMGSANLPAPEYNRRLKAMMGSFEAKRGTKGLENAEAFGQGQIASRDNRAANMDAAKMQQQNTMDLLKQQQSMELPASTKAQIDMIGKLMGNPNLSGEQLASLGGMAFNQLGGAVGGVPQSGSGNPFDVLKPATNTPFPALTGDREADKKAFDSWRQMGNQGVPQNIVDKELSKQGQTRSAINPPQTWSQAITAANAGPDARQIAMLKQRIAENANDPAKVARLRGALNDYMMQTKPQQPSLLDRTVMGLSDPSTLFGF